jgi:hypothetical protein
MQQSNNHPFRIITETEIKEVTGGIVAGDGGCVPSYKIGEDGGPIYTTMATGEEGGEPRDIFL